MSAATDLLADAAARGVRLRVHESGKLAASGPLDDRLRDQLCAHRDELLAYLAMAPQTAPCARCARFSFPVMDPPVICFWCKRRMGTMPSAETQDSTSRRVGQ